MRGTMPGAPKNPKNIASSFFNTVYLLRFEHGGAKLVSCHLTSARPCLQRPEIFPKFFEINEKQCATNTRKCPAANYIGVFWQSAKKNASTTRPCPIATLVQSNEHDRRFAFLFQQVEANEQVPLRTRHDMYAQKNFQWKKLMKTDTALILCVLSGWN